MRDRRTVTWLTVLAIGAAITQLLVWWLRPPPKPVAMVGPPRSSYQLDDFTLHAFGQDGKLAFTMTAPHLARREGNDSLYVNAPKYFFVGSDGSEWYGTSQYAWIDSDNDLVKLIGKIDMRRPPTTDVEAAQIHTADATVWTRDKRMATAAPSVIREPGSILRGVGMKADFDTHELELLSDVHATLSPRHDAH
ncbi:MAG TPA: LPS export ABC transporter periplasmic protein LptC [Rhodanobacteraceae bacterium]|jgi:lipopolysaccharide export system protein LptC|nr:LPS export ABC transporter periplasmic protein LptC [Rhodanobacteraceae bacterium]